MSLQDVERSIVTEARVVLANSKVRLKDLMEWRTTPFDPHPSEIVLELNTTCGNLWAAFPAASDKRPTPHQ